MVLRAEPVLNFVKYPSPPGVFPYTELDSKGEDKGEFKFSRLVFTFEHFRQGSRIIMSYYRL